MLHLRFILVIVPWFTTLFAFAPVSLISLRSCNRNCRLQNYNTALQSVTPVISPTPRVQRLKEISFQKETLRDITAAEFALRVEIKNDASTIDYDRLISTLDNKLELLEQRGIKSPESQVLVDRLKRTQAELVRIKSQVENQRGQRAANTAAKVSTGTAGSESLSRKDPSAAAKLSQAVADNERLKEIQESLRVIVREDGTVDWDGAKETGKEVAKFGAELWERLNGKEESEGLPSLAEMFGQAQAKAPETPQVEGLRCVVNNAKKMLDEVLLTRNDLRASLREDRKKGVEIQASNVQMLRRLDVRVKDLEKRLRLCTLDLDIERICVYLQQELESSLEPVDQRIFIAEVALIDKQLTSIMAGLELDAGPTPSLTEILENDDRKLADLTLVDEDELNLIVGEVEDLKARLGLDTSSPIMDWGSLGVLAAESMSKIRTGLSFYGEGTKLLFNDVQYAGTLLAKAVSGTTLKPREVNTVRRTGKDLLTLIPFTIILIIPLSPVGHVLVFSFIQRFFPEFYPSCYTDKRMNLCKLFSEIEKSDDDLDLGEEPPPALWEGWLPALSSVRASLKKLKPDAQSEITAEDK